MKMKDLIKLAETKEKENEWSIYTFLEYFDIDDYIDITKEMSDRVTSIQPIKWYSIDTVVGMTFYYFDNVFIGLSFQAGRKCNKEFFWESQEKYDILKKFILSLKEEKKENINIVDFEKVLSYKGYQIDFYDQILYDHRCFYEGEEILFKEPVMGTTFTSGREKIKIKTGSFEGIVSMNEIDIQYF